MFTLDDSFLDMVGLSDMPAELKNNFLAYAQDQLEVRVGEKMSNDLSDAQLEVFERIIDNDKDMINAVIGDNYKEDQLYQALLRNSEAEEGSDEFLGELATAKWLNSNCPQYQDIIRDTFQELRDEIFAQKDAILANS